MSKERLRGGRADGKPDKKYDKKQIEKGVVVEREHSTENDIRKEIAKDHLEEIPDYYDRLDEMEEEAKKEKKFNYKKTKGE